MKKIKIAIIGCGTIGSSLARVIARRFKAQAERLYLCDHHAERLAALCKKIGPLARPASLREGVRQADFVIEAASVAVAKEIAGHLKPGQEMLVMSVGGLLDEKVRRDLERKQIRLWVPSGAVAGVDALLAAKEAGLRSVKIVTRKPPKGLAGAPYFKTRKFPKLSGKKEACVFKGSALEAIRAFPQNINVAAVLSLAGLGARKTRVEIWTSKAYGSNQHEVTLESGAGTVRTVTRNVPSPENPKTSALALHSAAALLGKIFSSRRIGT